MYEELEYINLTNIINNKLIFLEKQNSLKKK
jgi:hypothetical protein